MTEFETGALASIAIAGLAVVCFFYMWGGRSGKWKRRFVGAFLACALVNFLMLARGIWSPWFLTLFPSLSIGFHLGYGSDIPMIKVVKRTICALFICGSGLICCFVLGGNAWAILPLHVGVGLWSVWLGVRNPIEAAAEEAFVCLLLLTGLIMYPFIGS
jgi:hypothetical protein